MDVATFSKNPTKIERSTLQPIAQNTAYKALGRLQYNPLRRFTAPQRRKYPRSSPLLVVTSAATVEQPISSTDPSQQPSTSSVDWRGFWYPIACTHDVVEPYPFTLLNEPIVIWKDADGKFHAFKDVCPHRLVPLSQGRVTTIDGESVLECPYHGWRFASDGECKTIPQGGDPSNPRACATAYQCTVKQNLIWVRLKPVTDPMNEDEIAVIPEVDDPSWGVEVPPMFRDLPMDYSTLLENLLDPAHTSFTHHASVSRRESSGNFADMQLLDKGTRGFTGTWPTGPRRGKLGAQNTIFTGPLMRHTIDAYDTKGFANVTAVYGIPMSEGKCRVIVRQPFKFKNPIPRFFFSALPAFLSHLGALNVFDDDNVFLHWQERQSVLQGISDKPLGQVFYMPNAADVYVSAFRSWLKNEAGGGPFGPQDAHWLLKAGPRLPMDDLLNHYHSHTEQCTICKTALKRLQIVQALAAGIGIAASIVSISAALIQWTNTAASTAGSLIMIGNVPLVAIGGVLAVVSGVVWRFCAKTIPRFYKGTFPPPRNTVKGEWTP